MHCVASAGPTDVGMVRSHDDPVRADLRSETRGGPEALLKTSSFLQYLVKGTAGIFL
jgi:hypothetical protein